MLGEIGVSCIRRGRVFRVIDNPLDYLDDEAIVRRYYNRLSSFLIHDLCVQSSILKARAFPVSIQQVMVALRLYFRQMLAMYTTFQVQVLARQQRCDQVSNVHITMPVSSHGFAKIINESRVIFHIPNNIGCIYGTHVRIKSPSVDEHRT